jgi:alkylated DNA repair dioxygenase AlkB
LQTDRSWYIDAVCLHHPLSLPIMLFADIHNPEILSLPDCTVSLFHGFLTPDETVHFLQKLISETPWQQDHIRIAGKVIPVPRLQAWYGEKQSFYAYSGIALKPLSWTPLLRELKSRIETETGACFNSVLVNYYRNGNDSVSWHADDEPELGNDPVIASLSLGASRTFNFRSKNTGNRKILACELENGSLLLMGEGTQTHWMHQIPKQPAVTEPRINLTFRLISAPGSQ